MVDDEPQIRRVMRVILTGERYEIIEARSGESALSTFREFLPDLILLDLNMPGIGGLETCRAIRDASDVPIIILTVRRGEGTYVADSPPAMAREKRHRALADGAVRYASLAATLGATSSESTDQLKTAWKRLRAPRGEDQ